MLAHGNFYLHSGLVVVSAAHCRRIESLVEAAGVFLELVWRFKPAGGWQHGAQRGWRFCLLDVCLHILVVGFRAAWLMLSVPLLPRPPALLAVLACGSGLGLVCDLASACADGGEVVGNGVHIGKLFFSALRAERCIPEGSASAVHSIAPHPVGGGQELPAADTRADHARRAHAALRKPFVTGPR